MVLSLEIIVYNPSAVTNYPCNLYYASLIFNVKLFPASIGTVADSDL